LQLHLQFSDTYILCFSPSVHLPEPATENLHISSQPGTEEEEVPVLEDMQNMRDIHEEKEDGGTKGEDWEEVRF